MKGILKLMLVALLVITSVTAFARIPNTQAASQVDINDAIELGLQYLNSTQAADGSWGGGYYPVACTAMAVLAFENAPHEHLPDNASDPYHTTVAKGLDYLFTQAHVQTLAAQTAGDPDTNGNGKGIYFSTSDTVYQTPMVLMAMVGSQNQSRVPTTAPAGTDPYVNGRSYHDIVVDIIDWIAWAQEDAATGVYRGGWRYNPNYGSSDNSNTQWPILGLLTAQLWGINGPAFVKSELKYWLAYSQNLGGNYNSNSLYGSFGYADKTTFNSVAESATGILGLTYCGEPKTNASIIAAQGYLVRDWLVASSWNTNFGNLYGMYGVMKACRLAQPTPIDFIVNYTGSPTIEWYNGTNQYADWLVNNQQPDGHWNGGTATTNVYLNTAFGVLILEYVPVKVQWNLTVHVVDDSTNNPISGANVAAVGPESRAGITDGGEVDFLKLQAGPYTVTASKAGYDTASVFLDLSADTEITIRLKLSGAAPVGGFEAPLNTLAMLAPWILLGLATSLGAVVAAKRKRKY